MDYYEILQVHPRADTEAITAAYTRLRDFYDPARLDGAAEELVELARQKRDAIERAYAVLADPARRESYDAELAAAQSAPLASAPSVGSAMRPGAPEEVVLDYRPLPPARRAERARGFDAQPVRVAPHDGRSSGPSARRLTIPVVLVGVLALVLAVSLAATQGNSLPPTSGTPAPASLDQFEALIAQAQRVAEQNPDNPQAWIEYGNMLYNSAEIVRENAPESALYQQRLPRWLQATEAYSQALRLQPDNAAARADLGASACFYGAGTGDQRFVQRGIVEARRAAQESPNDARVQLSLGQCLVSDQPPQTQEALESWQRTIQLAPPDSPLAAQAQELIARYSK